MTLRKQALAIFQAAVRAADPVEAVERHFRVQDGSLIVAGRRYKLDRFERVFVIVAGKASAASARSASESPAAW